MTFHGLDPADRDSADYKRLCRDLGYRITMDAALDNISLNVDAFVVGPFTKEAANPDWIWSELSHIGRSLQDVEVKVVLVELADEELYRKRIQDRQSPLDEWKFQHWDEFRKAFGNRSVKWPLPSSNVKVVDNSNPDITKTVAVVEHFIYD